MGTIADKSDRLTCQHCRRVYAIRPRQLCWGCYYKPGVRELYPMAGSELRTYHSPVGTPGDKISEPEPTDVMPGTVEKLAVLEERARLGQRLWHPLDATMEDREPENMLHDEGECYRARGGSRTLYGKPHTTNGDNRCQ